MEKRELSMEERVIRGLKACATSTWEECERCPYHGADSELDLCWEKLCLDAAQLLEGGAG